MLFWIKTRPVKLTRRNAFVLQVKTGEKHVEKEDFTNAALCTERQMLIRSISC